MQNLEYLKIKKFITESKECFDELTLAYTTHGKLNKNKDNAIFVIHPFTANANPMQWWPGIFGNGRVFDKKKYFIVCINIPGSPYGSTNPLSKNPKTNKPYYYNFPTLTPRDVVQAFEYVRKELKIEQIRILIGISMGGQIAFQWIHSHTQVAKRAIIIAANPKTTPWMAASLHVQRNALLLDPTWKKKKHKNAGKEGMKVARQIGFLSYRSPRILSLSHMLNIGKHNDADEKGFVSAKKDLSKSPIQVLHSYLDYQGKKFLERFNAFSYDALLTLMESHDIAYNSSSLEDALREIKADVLLVSIDSDMLFPTEEIKKLKKYIKNARHREMSSIYGHDAILIEYKQLEDIIIDYLCHVDEAY